METKYYSLGTSENNRFVSIIRIIFGIVVFAIAIFWTIFNVRRVKTDATLWLTIIFLSGFGLYQIWSGLGRATQFIELGSNNIRLKKNSLRPSVLLLASEIEKIEFFPLNVIFFFKTKKRILLRFGTMYHDANIKVKEELMYFAESNNITFEIIEEKL